MATFGQTGDNAGSSTSSADSNLVNKAADAESTPASNGTLVAVHARVWLSAAGSSLVKGVIWSDTGHVLATGDEVMLTATAEADQTFPFSGANAIALTAGTKYAYGILFQDPGAINFTWSRQATAGASWKNSDTYADGPQDPLGSGTVAGPVDMYVEYTPSAAGATVKTLAALGVG